MAKSKTTTKTKAVLPVVVSPPLQPTLEAAPSTVPPASERGMIKGKLSVLQAALREPEIIVPKTCAEYVSEFKQCAAKTARATLEMCRIVHEARETLVKISNEAFEQFCDQIGMKSSPATIVKFCCIGRLYSRFIKHESRLPTSWTSIYFLTQLPAQYFDQVIEKNQSFADLTGSQINSLVKQTLDLDVVQTKLPKEGKRPVFGKLVFRKNQIDDLDFWAMKKAIQEIEARLPVKFVINKVAEKLWDDRKLSRYEQTKRSYDQIELKPDLWDFGREANQVLVRSDVVAQDDDESEAD